MENTCCEYPRWHISKFTVWAYRLQYLTCPCFILGFEKYAQKLTLWKRTELHQPFTEALCEDMVNSEGWRSTWVPGFRLPFKYQFQCPQGSTKWGKSGNLQGVLAVEQMNSGTVSVYLNNWYGKITWFPPPFLVFSSSPRLLLWAAKCPFCSEMLWGGDSDTWHMVKVENQTI